MPDERVIQEIENILSDVVSLGGQGERTSIVPNMLVRDASPTDLSDYVIIADNRDDDNILALRVPGVVYADNDLVNVIFPQGGEAIAFQQGSGSTTSGLWDIVTGTDDIYYNKGDVGIGKSVAPDAALEVLDTAQAQLRLTFQEDTKYADFTVDTNHDLTIKPSSTGQIILQPTADSTDFFQVLDADGGTPILNIDSTNERQGISVADPAAKLEINALLATDIVLINKAAGSQSANIVEHRDSSDNVLGGVDERGVLFSHAFLDATSVVIGDNAGNSATTGAGNTLIGDEVGRTITTGLDNTAIGRGAMAAMTEGDSNVAIGALSMLACTTGRNNFAMGPRAMKLTTSGKANVAIGQRALENNISSDDNVAIGSAALKESTGTNNVGIGTSSGSNQVTGSNNLFLGQSAGQGVGAHNKSSCIMIGRAAGLNENSSFRLYIQPDSTATPLIYGEFENDLLKFHADNADTNVTHDLLYLVHNSSGTPAANFGVGLLYQLESSTTAGQDAARISALWATATHATRKARSVWSVFDTAEREGIRIEASGSAPMLGFYGVTAVVRPTALTSPLTQITHTGPAAPDYAIATPVDSGVGSAWGFSNQNEFETIMSVILNLQTRVDELETKQQALGLLT